ncbi:MULTISPECIES: GFA family protein [unclassified Mesorhizobium]|uniref:GFA family protein n=1 Tax=unclassified Mesorhizobium TaxID=325217 RepID=UPI000FCBD4D6|nr:MULTISPECIES: GFA family protein [unclassified Mesorhizobium]TGP26792.1 GFA family protein [Mesorhizobium sp. M1D.F.Ca.ET.231.01.1.1]TGP38749.1 GFA family protein [Mesorhizobium sp. M1D.F.Ca.ET.234.01.1.1]TGS50958.1 GFA family protein [Mesorhizobium sp. M1D.F.Ca.ET.184.01.1.1]TGS66842.1 GFA family protein [Mesorhizobium sp. M1D.F.Ca.ET.183.01.1.1]
MITGGCLCGAVRYESRAEAITARLCWCRFCQYIAAGNAAVSVCFLTAHFKVAGEMRDYESVADSGDRMHRRFCPACGVHLFSEAESRPHLIFVRAGTLDDPNMIRPTATIWTSMAPAWACIDTSLPTFEAQPPPVA